MAYLDVAVKKAALLAPIIAMNGNERTLARPRSGGLTRKILGIQQVGQIIRVPLIVT
jgi:hypothetical protein